MEEIFDFAYCRDFDGLISELKFLCANENWGDSDRVLKNYIKHTYKKLYTDWNQAEEDLKSKIITINAEVCCFNTGLFTEFYEPIYAYFKKNSNEGRQPWFMAGFRVSSDSDLSDFETLPERAQFFKNVDELIYDYRLEIRANLNHILGDEENIERLPASFRILEKRHLAQLLEGALQTAKKKVAANYRLAVPQYYKGSIQLLLPLCLDFDSDNPDLVIAIKKEGNIYSARTCLTIDMAYNNARLIVKPEVDWLKI